MSFTDLTGGLSLLNIVELGQLFDVSITNPTDGQVLTYQNGEWINGSGGGGGSVQSVTGLNTDNADPANPVVKISVDGATITGQGTPADPLVAVTGGGGSVTDVSVVNANGFDGTVANSTTTPAMTLKTTITGVIKGNGTAISAASAGTDYTALAFKTISVSGQSDVVADTASDTLTFAEGSNITITTNASTDTITIASSGGGTPGGSNTQVQYNNSSSFGGISGATTDGTTLTLVAPVLGTPASGTLTNCDGTASSLTAGHVTNATFTTALTVNTGTLTLTANAANTSVLTIGAGATSISGANTGDQTITLTGAVTGSGNGSFATTIATPGTLTVASTNSTATAHTHAITSSSAPGAAASLLATDSSGIIGSTGTRIVKGWFTDLTVTNNIAGSITGNAATVTTNANLTGVITSSGNATSIASQTGTGTKFVVDNTPTIITPSITTGFTIGGAAASGKFIVGNGTNYVASTSTIPTSAGATANKVLLSDGTNYALSTPTFPNASATSGKTIRSDGTNWIASTATLSDAPSTAGKVLVSDGTNWITSTPTFPNASATSGKVIISDGTNWVASASLFAQVGGTYLGDAVTGNQTIVLVQYAPYAFTINTLKNLGTVSGTVTGTLNINGTPVTGLSSLSLTSTPAASTSASAANVVAAGDKITFVTTAASSLTGLLAFSLIGTRS